MTWPIPMLTRWPAAELDGERIWLGRHGLDAPAHEEAVPPAELYLRQAQQIDPDDGTALVAFVREVGGVPIADRPSGGARDLHDPDLCVRPRFAARRNRRYVEPDYVAGRGWGVHIDEVAYRLRVLGTLGRHAIAYRRGEYLAPIWTDASAGSHECRSEECAWIDFTLSVDAALNVFHPRVQVVARGSGELNPLGATFLEAGVLQIVNDLTHDVDYLICPNCEITFARSIGGSTHYSRSTGVTYCSPRCGTNARVRAHRERRRAERS